MNSLDTPLIAELHVDDLALEAGAPWCEAANLVSAIAEVAQAAHASLCFRFRRAFAQESARRDGGALLRALEAAGHEVGTHAHGRGLRAAQRAVSACGIANRGATPGMVQTGDKPGRLWREAAELGFAWITDHPPHRAWAYGGVLPWRPGPRFRPDEPPLAPVMIETSADPFAWGLLERRGERVLHQHRLGPEHFERLGVLLRGHARPLPAGSRPYFSFALHEHNFCAQDSLRPRPQALDALGAFLARHSVVTAGSVAATLEAPEPLDVQPDHRALRLARRVRVASRPTRRSLGRRRGAPSAGPFEVSAGPRTLRAVWHGPSEPRAVLLLSHAGLQGGSGVLLRPFGVDPAAIAGHGFALVAYDRSGTGRSPFRTPLTPGRSVHVQDFRAVIRAVRARLEPGIPVGVMSFSSGILPPLRAGEPLAFLLDGEAPADRWSLRPPHGADAPRDDALAHLPTDSVEAWRGLEPAHLLAGLACPYHRFQAELDHVHGRLDLHARLMLEAARAVGLPEVRANGAERLRTLPGRLHAHGRLIQGWILEALEAATSRPTA